MYEFGFSKKNGMIKTDYPSKINILYSFNFIYYFYYNN